jgi:hypothetical protein
MRIGNLRSRDSLAYRTSFVSYKQNGTSAFSPHR